MNDVPMTSVLLVSHVHRNRSRCGLAADPRVRRGVSPSATAPSITDAADDNPSQAAARYKHTPWDYLESEGVHIVIRARARCHPRVLPDFIH